MSDHEKTAVKPRLGRGLSSLISTLTTAQPAGAYQSSPAIAGEPKSAVAVAVTPAVSEGPLREIAIDDVVANPFQPRRRFSEQELAELAASIAANGVIQPIVVAPSKDPSSSHPYVLVAGERRLRAAKLAGLTKLPAYVRQPSQQQMLQWALIENIHRSDLNPIERALAMRQCMDRFNLNQTDLADQIGVPRPSVANHLRMLDLHQDVQDWIAGGQLSFGHAKVLTGLLGRADRQLELAKRVIADQWSVRQLEEAVGEPQASSEPSASAAAGRVKPPYLRDIEERLSSAIGTKVLVHPGRSRNTGKVVIEYYSLDDFDRISGKLGVAPEA